jgi:outer membrane lipase/esterase
MGRWTGRAAALAALLMAAPAAAAVLDYSSFHVLGDSLSDAGNVHDATRGAEPPSPPYWRGRFSNGPVWADRVIRRFRDAGLPTGNHAWGGAKSRGSTTAESLGLPAQAARYRALDEGRRGGRPLLGIWIGSNDILFADDGASIRRVGRLAADRVGDVATALVLGGVDDFLLFNLPDLGELPTYNGDRAGARRATAGARAFNRELADQIDDLRDIGAEVRTVNTRVILDDILAHPRRYGLRDTDTPCLDADDNPCTPRQERRRAFFDELHPARQVHRAVADAALARIGGAASAAATAPAPVPLPAPAALLAAGLLALGLAARRRAGQPPKGRPHRRVDMNDRHSRK